MVMGRKRGLIYGVGINDSDYKTRTKLECGKVVWCPFYLKWKKMLERCYANKQQKSYIGCLVCQEWLKFSNFKAWMEKQEWEGKELDKDLLGDGLLYSPENCIFLCKKVNSFLVRANDIGFTWNKYHGKFQAQCSNPLICRNEFIGYFDTKEEAHLAWKAKKHEHACLFADMQENEIIANALRNRFK